MDLNKFITLSVGGFIFGSIFAIVVSLAYFISTIL